MPINRAHIQFTVILLGLPLQYYFVQFFGSNEISRSLELKRLTDQWQMFKEEWFRIESWKQWLSGIVWSASFWYSIPYSTTKRGRINFNDNIQSPAIEVFRYRSKSGFYGFSVEPRSHRPPHVRFRVGQVIRHKQHGYRGVIFNWDETARAPSQWILAMKNPNIPNYAVLVDTRDRKSPQMTYIPETDIEVLSHQEIMHFSLANYFESFDGTQYLPNRWLRNIYPKD